MAMLFSVYEERKIVKKRKIVTAFILITAVLLSGCGHRQEKVKETDDHLTVYIWDNKMIKDIVPYIKTQLPDQDIEFIVGNNNVDLYNYLEEHGDLPDVITTRRFSEKDAEGLQPYLLDFGSYDIVSEYYPYTLQYYTDTDGAVKWLPVCGIPETMIANKTLFDKYGIEIPENYEEFAECCEKFHENGVKPYVSELAMDWAAHSLVQGAALDQFSSIDGIEWRTQVESLKGEDAFKDDFWKKTFAEVDTFIKDTYLTSDDLENDLTTVRNSFANGEAAMFRGTPSVMEALRSITDDELVRILYFSQTSDESWVYTYPSFNVALNSELAENEDKLDLAMEVLDCFLSEEGQKLVADGDGMISYNADVESTLDGLNGIEDEIEKNAFYIRFASNGSFSGSLQAVQGILSGEMNETQAYNAFKKEVTSEKKEESAAIDFQNQYEISLNSKCGRDAASSILTTVRKKADAQLAFSSYYYYASSIYAGECTSTELNMMVSHNDEAYLYLAELNGAQIKKLVEQYLAGQEGGFAVTNKYELPISSGMKLILQSEKDKFVLDDIEVNGDSIKDKETYTIMLTDEMADLLKKIYPEQTAEQIEDTVLSAEWTSVTGSGQQPSEPEDYIKIK